LEDPRGKSEIWTSQKKDQKMKKFEKKLSLGPSLVSGVRAGYTPPPVPRASSFRSSETHGQAGTAPEKSLLHIRAVARIIESVLMFD
jgi:hypothetical protein